MALMPGRIINADTLSWIDSAKKTLAPRGGDSIGWALAYGILCRAKAHNGENAYKLLRKLLCKKTNDNLWDERPPFRIDGNFGATAGIAEMLLQSGNGENITLFAATPKEGKNAAFDNLRARGNLAVSAKRKSGKIEYCRIQALSGGEISVRVDGVMTAVVINAESGEKGSGRYKNDKITFKAEKGGVYDLRGFEKTKPERKARNLTAAFKTDGVTIKWRKADEKCAVYRAVGNDKEYKLLGVTENSSFHDKDFSLKNKARLTYKVVIADNNYSQKPKGRVVFLSPATQLEKDRYEKRLKDNNVYAND